MMIDKLDLFDLGFTETPDIFSGKIVYILGYEDVDILGNICKVPIIYYNIEQQTCKVARNEFCIISRECKTGEEIIKFIESINFLFNISICYNKKII